MNYLSEKHKQLSESQQSGLMKWFGQLPMDKKAVAIGLSLTVGIGSAAMAWKGESSDRIYFCVRTPQKKLVCQDQNNRPFRMTPHYWEQWKLEGMPSQVVRDPAMGVNGLVKATNPYKPFWAFGGFLGFALAGWMLRHCQEEEKQRAVFEDIAQKRDAAKAEMAARSELLESYRDVAIAEVQLQADLDLIANDRTVDITKAEIYAHTEIEVTQMEATDAIFEAQTAGMTDQQKAEYIKQLREMKTPYLQGSQTLQGTIDPNDKVTGGEQPAIAPGDKYRWINNTIGYPTLIFGGMGAGKSWTTREIIWKKVQAGWNIVALDPHGTQVEWRGVRLITGYKEIAEFMQWYMDEMRQRYEDYRKSGLTEEQWTEQLRNSGKMLSVICEEFTTWTDNIVEPMPDDCEDEKWKPDPDFIGKWFRCAMTESRKQLMIPLFVAHDRTMEILAKAKGLSKLRDAALLEVELIATIDPITTEAKASGRGRIKLPGHGQWIDIELPKLDHKRIDFRLDESRTVNEPPSIDKATLERIYELEFNLGNKAGDTQDEPKKLSPMAQKLYEYLTRTERIEADVREFKGNFKVNGERFIVEQIKGWMYEIVGAGMADWIAEGVIKLNQI
ncbi:ATP-binding protein [Nostoc sp. UIC 10630]|uniref:ATP-binding protein n=1 Tax=Nostoc sp. UIC 10630 TaxID=2100146 RepID=UPI0013CFA738|nr:ATP-binding protein [Nostoc sp. UIC 10630]NEU83860.1 ATP-binding protein [Nostoc sp. UIC 10630]